MLVALALYIGLVAVRLVTLLWQICVGNLGLVIWFLCIEFMFHLIDNIVLAMLVLYFGCGIVGLINRFI